MPLDWSQCTVVESVPGKVSGVWVFRGTRMPVATVFENLEAGASIEEIMEWFDVTREQIVAVLDFAARSLAAQPAATDAHPLRPRGAGTAHGIPHLQVRHKVSPDVPVPYQLPKHRIGVSLRPLLAQGRHIVEVKEDDRFGLGRENPEETIPGRQALPLGTTAAFQGCMQTEIRCVLQHKRPEGRNQLDRRMLPPSLVRQVLLQPERFLAQGLVALRKEEMQ